MKIIKKIEELRKEIENERKKGKKIGLVKNMGYINKGNMEIVRRERVEKDVKMV